LCNAAKDAVEAAAAAWVEAAAVAAKGSGVDAAAKAAFVGAARVIGWASVTEDSAIAATGGADVAGVAGIIVVAVAMAAPRSLSLQVTVMVRSAIESAAHTMARRIAAGMLIATAKA
jgi:hypothetical protein